MTTHRKYLSFDIETARITDNGGGCDSLASTEYVVDVGTVASGEVHWVDGVRTDSGCSG